MLLVSLVLLACGGPAAQPADPAVDDSGGSSSGDGGSDGGAVEVGWAQVQAVLAENCYGCHKSSGIAVTLEGYENASVWADAIAQATTARRMPPWPPADECVPLRDVRGLTDDEIALLAEWADAGAPRGDADDLVLDPPDPGDADLWVQLDQPYTPDEGLEDDYRCFVVDPGLTEDAFVTSFEAFPGNTAIVHHVLLYDDVEGRSVALDEADDGPGYACFGGPGVDDSQTLGGWVPGMDDGVVFPEGTGVRLRAGTKLVLQIHYAPGQDPGRPDQTSMDLRLATEPVQELYMVPMYDTRLNIPPGETDHVEGASFTNDYIEFRLRGLTPHMHKIGKQISAGITRDGDEHCLIDIPDWDFSYQQFYWFEEPFTVELGDELWLECVYDNSASNPDNPHSPPVEVHWGDGTGDEMCLVYAMGTL